MDVATTRQLETDDRALAGGDRLEDLWELGWHDGLPVVTGGDAGRFSAVISPWVGFGLGSTPVTEVVDEDAGPTSTATTATTRRIRT